MKCCEGKTSSTSPPTHTHTAISNGRTHIHTPYSPLPQPATVPPPDPVIPSSPLRLITPSPPICHSSPNLHLLSPLSRSRLLPAGRLSVDVKVGGVVSNSPSDTGFLTFHCTLRISLPPHRRRSSSAVTAPGAFWGSSLALDWEGGSRGETSFAVMTQSVRPDPPPPPPTP